MEHAAQPVRGSEARMSRNPARSGTRKMDLAQTIREVQQPLVERLDGVEHRLDGVEHRLDGLERRFDGVELRLDGLESRFDGLENRFDRLETRFDRSEERWEAWRELSEARWVDMGKEITRRYEKLDEKIDREIGSLRRDFSAQLAEHKRETAAGFARMDAQYSDLRQEMLAGFAEMRDRIDRGQRNTVIMVTSVVVLLLTWLELRDAALALFAG